MEPTSYPTVYLSIENSINAEPRIPDGKLSESTRTLIEKEVIRSKKAIFEQVKEKICQYGEVKFNDQSEYNFRINHDPELHAKAYARTKAQHYFEERKVNNLLHEETCEDVEIGDSFKYQVTYKNIMTGEERIERVRWGGTFEFEAFVNSAKGEFESALEAEIMYASGIEKKGWLGLW